MIPTQDELAREMSDFFQRIQARKADVEMPEPFQVTHSIVQLAATEPGPPAEVVDVDSYAGDPVPNPDAQGL